MIDGLTELSIYIKSARPLVWVISQEKERVLRDLKGILDSSDAGSVPFLIRQTAISCPHLVSQELHDSVILDPRASMSLSELVSALLEQKAPVGLTNPHINKILSDHDNQQRLRAAGAIIFWENPDFCLREEREDSRFLCSVLPQLQQHGISIVGVAPGFCTLNGPVPHIIASHFAVVNYILPDIEKLREVLTKELEEASNTVSSTIAAYKKVKNTKLVQTRIARLQAIKLEYSPDEVHQILRASAGMTAFEFRDHLEHFLMRDSELKPLQFLEAKAAIIKKSHLLELINQPEGLDQVGGLEEAKKFVRQWKNCFSEEAQKFGVESLKGLTLTGPPGTGKSLFAKAVAAELGLPLLRLDIGRLLGGVVGQSESQAREAIKLIIACAPVTLWIDEIEKGLAGSTGNSLDSGVMARVLGTLLTAMEEEFDGVIPIATSNNIKNIPPEFLRRFEEVFFVDLPSAKIREQIFSIHLKKRDRDPALFDLSALASFTEGFTGAEIEKIVRRAIANSFASYQGREDISTDNLTQAVKGVNPISQLMKEEIDSVRTWAKEHNAIMADATSEKTKMVELRRGLGEL